MSVNEADIKRMKSELKKDLEALERVEAMLRKDASPSIGNVPPSSNNGSGRDLRGLVLAILHEAKASRRNLRPSEIVQAAIAKGYPFKSDRHGMGSVTKVLTRLRLKNLVERTKDGTYTGT